MILIDLNGKWQMKRTDEEQWIDAVVPGSVYNDLLRAGKMKDPFFRDNEYEIRDLCKFDYEYKRIFQVKAEDLKHDRIVSIGTMGFVIAAAIRKAGSLMERQPP